MSDRNHRIVVAPWEKSCTTWDGRNHDLEKNGINHLSTIYPIFNLLDSLAVHHLFSQPAIPLIKSHICNIYTPRPYDIITINIENCPWSTAPNDHNWCNRAAATTCRPPEYLERLIGGNGSKWSIRRRDGNGFAPFLGLVWPNFLTA